MVIMMADDNYDYNNYIWGSWCNDWWWLRQWLCTVRTTFFLQVIPFEDVRLMPQNQTCYPEVSVSVRCTQQRCMASPRSFHAVLMSRKIWIIRLLLSWKSVHQWRYDEYCIENRRSIFQGFFFNLCYTGLYNVIFITLVAVMISFVNSY